LIQSRGALVKSPNIVWAGTPSTWGTWPSSLELGNRWSSYAEIYTRQLWVYVVANKRARGVARLPLKVYERADEGRPSAADSPYGRLLAKPNDRHSSFFLWLWSVSTFDVYGEAMWGKVRDAGGRPVMLTPLHPTCMHPEDERDGRVIWRFQNSKVRIDNIDSADLVHFKTYNPSSFTRGLSPLEPLRATLENEDAARRSTSSFWRNGARPGVALVHPGKLSQAAGDRLKLNWNDLAAGADKTGMTVVLEEGMKPEKFTLTAEEAQYIETRKLNREEVCGAYDMPPPVVHILDRATFSNITEQMRSLYRDTMAPILRGFEAELEMQLRGAVRPGASEPDFGDDVYSEFLMDEVLRGDFEARSEAYQKAVNSGWMKPSEVREKENLPPSEGADRLLVNGTMIPITAAYATALGAMVRAGFDPEASVAALGLPPIAHTGLVPVTVQGEQVAEGLPAGAVRSLMGRLSRFKSLDDINEEWLVEGLNGSSAVVLEAFQQSKAAGEDVASLRARIQGLGVPA
jgi:HK97 family phage portal protein